MQSLRRGNDRTIAVRRGRPGALAAQAGGDGGHPLAVGLGGIEIALRDFFHRGVGGERTSRPTEPPRWLASAWVAALVLAGSTPRLTQMPPCCEARVCSWIIVAPLSPTGLALLVKPPNTLSCQARTNQALDEASANFLNCQLGPPM
jgi:hypothetical protein